MRWLLALALCAGCVKPDPVPSPTPPVVAPSTAPVPSGLDGWLLFQRRGDWWVAELWGDDAATVAREATASGTGPTYGTDPAQVADADPEWARRFLAGWSAEGLMSAHALTGTATEGPLTLQLAAVVPAVRDDQALGLRVWATAVGGPTESGLAVFHPTAPPVSASGLGAPCAPETPALDLDETGWTVAESAVGCVHVPLEDASHLVAFEHPVLSGDRQGRCVTSAVRRDHGGVQRFRTSCREVSGAIAPTGSSPVAWWTSEGQRRWVVAWDRADAAQRCLAATPPTDRPWSPVACVIAETPLDATP